MILVWEWMQNVKICQSSNCCFVAVAFELFYLLNWVDCSSGQEVIMPLMSDHQLSRHQQHVKADSGSFGCHCFDDNNIKINPWMPCFLPPVLFCSNFFFFFSLCLLFFRHHGSLSACSGGSPPPLTSSSTFPSLVDPSSSTPSTVSRLWPKVNALPLLHHGRGERAD